MRKVFLKFFFSIFSITILTLLIQSLLLIFEYRQSQERWSDNVYRSFINRMAGEVEANTPVGGWGSKNIGLLISQCAEERISGFIVRDANGKILLTLGKTPRGTILPEFYSDLKGEAVSIQSSEKHTILNIVNHSDGSATVVTTEAEDLFRTVLSFPKSVRSQDIVGSLTIVADGREFCTIDVLTYSPMTYEYSKEVINSCLTSLMISIPINLLITILTAWYISSKNTKYIGSIRKALSELANGRSNVEISKNKNNALNEITDAIKSLDSTLQANSRSRKAWLRSISHDLNTPASAMKLIIDGINDHVFPADEKTLLALQKEITVLTDRIRKVVDLATLQADTKPEIKLIDTQSFTEGVLNNFDKVSQVETQILTPVLDCDQTLMARACKELLDNAAQVSSEKITWKIDSVDNKYRMQFLNQGVLPISQDFFEPWTRGDWSRTVGGSGLGLPIAGTILYLHKGTASITQKDDNTVLVSIIWPKEG